MSREMRVDESPRVLLLTTQIPQSIYAGCLQLFRVFQGYPSDRLLVIGPAPHPKARLLPCRYETLSLSLTRLINTRFHKWINLFNVVGGIRDFDIRLLDRLIGNFKPQLVVTVMDCFSYSKWAWLYARRRRLPLFAVTMDDPTQFEQVHRWAKPLQLRAWRKIYGYAARSLGVSKEMVDHLQDRYGGRSHVFHFGPLDNMVPRNPIGNARLRHPPRLTLGYAGATGYYGNALFDWTAAFEESGATLRVYGPEPNEAVRNACVSFEGHFQPEEVWEKIKSECDAVILSYSFDSSLAHLYRTHFPTKLSEYCWLGMPIILTGPESATGVKWGLRHPKAAVTLTGQNQKQMTELLCQIKEHHNLRIDLGREAIAVARDEFEPSQIRERFRLHLREAVRSTTTSCNCENSSSRSS